MITVGIRKNAVYGVMPTKPLANFPAGRIRLRLRNTDFARVFVKTATGIRQFIVRDAGDTWEPLFEQGRNERSKSP